MQSVHCGWELRGYFKVSLSDIYIINGTRVFGIVFSYSGNIFTHFILPTYIFLVRCVETSNSRLILGGRFMKGSFRVSHYRG